MEKRKKSTVNKFVGNTSWMMAKQIYSMLLSLVVGALTARYLGPSNYGLLNYGATIISLFTTISTLGLNNVIINELVKRPDKAGSYLGSVLLARFVCSVASVFVVWGIIYFLEPDNKLLQIVTVLQAVAIVFQCYEVFTYWFQYKLEMKIVSIATMIALTVVAIWRIALLANNASVQFFALSNSINYLVAATVVLFIFLKSCKIKLAVSLSDMKYLLSKGQHLIIASIAVVLYCQIDKVMIGKMLNETQLGFYAAATTIACLWEFIPNALISSSRPLILEKKETDYAEYNKRYQILMLGITYMGLLVGIGFTVFGGIAIKILYGSAFMEARWPLAILIWSTSAAMIGNVRNVWLVSENCEKWSKYLTFAGAVVNAILNYFLIKYIGIIGASVATLFSQVFVGIIAPVLFKSTRRFTVLYFKSFTRTPELVSLLKARIR